MKRKLTAQKEEVDKSIRIEIFTHPASTRDRQRNSACVCVCACAVCVRVCVCACTRTHMCARRALFQEIDSAIAAAQASTPPARPASWKDRNQRFKELGNRLREAGMSGSDVRRLAWGRPPPRTEGLEFRDRARLGTHTGPSL